MKLYSIAGWSDHFETSETRKLVSLHWWAKKNKHDGLGFRRIVQQRDKVELYCAWTLIGDVASRATPKTERGKLVRNGRPLTAEDLELMTGFPRSIFDRAFDFFSRPDQGWLTVTEMNEEPHANAAAPVQTEGAPGVEAVPPADLAESPGTPGDCPGGREGRERREGREGDAPAPPGDVPESRFAHIPSEAEFLDAFMLDGIPVGYLKKQWAWFDGNNEWLDKNGRLKRYQVIVRSRWAEDRAKWQGKNGGGKPKSEPNI